MELMTLLEGRVDLSTFEFKTGRFLDVGEVPPKRVRVRTVTRQNINLTVLNES